MVTHFDAPPKSHQRVRHQFATNKHIQHVDPDISHLGTFFIVLVPFYILHFFLHPLLLLSLFSDAFSPCTTRELCVLLKSQEFNPVPSKKKKVLLLMYKSTSTNKQP